MRRVDDVAAQLRHFRDAKRRKGIKEFAFERIEDVRRAGFAGDREEVLPTTRPAQALRTSFLRASGSKMARPERFELPTLRFEV